MEDQTNPQSIPISHKVVKFLTAATLGTGFLVLSGLILTGTVMALVLATPVFVIFSPILLPAAIAVFLAVSGFLLSGAFGLAAVSALAWIYNYLAGKHPPGADKLEYARMAIASRARDISERAKEYGHYVQSKAQEVAQMS